MMRSLLVVGMCAVCLLPASGQKFAPNVVKTRPLSPEEQRKAFTLPEGFEIQLVASEPDIQKPLNIAFDDQGRLWATGSIEYPYPSRGKARDELRVLEDFGPDGKARKITTFARGLNIPIGLLPLARDAALVYTIPNILRITPAGQEKLYVGYGFADTHGMTSSFTPGFDGWIYACHGFSNTSNIKNENVKGIKLQSGNTYRMQADGSAIEQFTWGQVNPFGLCFDRLGNLYSADCHSQPIYQLLRGGRYPSFGKPHDGLGFAPQMITGFKGSTAIAGVAIYEADQFPAAYRGSAFIGDVMTNDLLRFTIRYEGSTPVAKAVPFLTCKDQWFRPVDVKLGPDGALYIADFYNSIIGHYEVPLAHPARDKKHARIWRVIYKGKGTPGRSDFTRASIAELVKDLAHPNLTVRLRATNQLAKRGKEAKEAVHQALVAKPTPEAHAHLLWVAHRLGGVSEKELSSAFDSREEIVRVHACRVVSERHGAPGAWERKLLLASLADASANVQRAGADAMGHRPHVDYLAPLLSFCPKVPTRDTHLLHTARMALRNQLVSKAAWAVATDLRDARQLRTLASVVPGQPTAEAGAFAGKLLAEASFGPRQAEQLLHHAIRFGNSATRIAALKQASGRPAAQQAGFVRVYFRALQERGIRPDKGESVWVESVASRLLASSDEAQQRAGAGLCAQARLTGTQNKLRELAASKKSEATRLAALNTLATLDGAGNARILGAALVDSGLSLPGREQCAALLARVNQPATRAALLAALPTAPARLQTSIAAHLAAGSDGANALLDAVAAGKASARLLQERAVTVRLHAAGVPRLDARLKKLTAGLPAADAKLAALLVARKRSFLRSKHNLVKGALLFTKHCANCHQVGGKGAKVGPQLDGIGLRGLDRLLEDILDPNRNVDQAFRTTTIRTTRGVIVQGLALREDGAVLVLADAMGKEVRVPLKDIETRTLSNLSPMPATLADQVSEAELPDLLAYLLAQRPARP